MTWSTLLRKLVPVLAVLLVLGAAGTAMAQTDPGRPEEPRPAPVRPVEAREICVPAGLALTVIQADGVLAEAIPPAPTASEPNRPDPSLAPAVRRIVVTAPAIVGACAEAQGYWAEESGGASAARLVLYENADAPNAADLKPVARDAFERTLRGPARAAGHLRATTALREPGTYVFAAVLTARAEAPATSAAVARVDEDSTRVRFVVEVRAPERKGRIEGIVEDVEGKPIAGARVTALRPPVRDANVPLNAERLAVRVAAAQDIAVASAAAASEVVPFGPEPSAGPTVVSGRDGRYVLEVPAGQYLVQAAARGYRPQWYDGADTVANATPVAVKSGQVTSGIDFLLAKLPEPQPVERGVIEGVVTDEAGTPIGGAMVAARRAPDADPVRPLQDQPRDPSAGPVATTRDDGSYRIVVPEGPYYVAAQARGYVMEWFEEAAEFESARMVKVAADAPVGGVDFTLAKAPEPEPPAPVKLGTISGFVGTADGPIAGAIVTARLTRDADPEPLQEPRDRPSGPVARTDEEGKYVIEVPEGAYLVVAQARGFGVQWYKGVAEPRDATPVKVAEGVPADGIDFALEPVADVVPPAPAERGTIRGTATMVDGQAVVGARVLAIPVERLRTDPNVPPGALPFPTDVPAAGTNREGVFEIPAPVGRYVVALLLARSDSSRDLVILYYDNVTDIAEASPVEVVAEEVTDGIDFTVK